MISKQRAEEILSKLVDYAGNCDYAVANLTGGKGALTRFANNMIHQNVLKKDYQVAIKIFRDGRSGCATGNYFSDEALNDIARAAQKAARYSFPEEYFPPSKELMEINPATKTNDSTGYDLETANCSPEKRADIVKWIINSAIKDKLTAFGTVETGDNLRAVYNSDGIFRYHTGTYTDHTLTLTNSNGESGWGDCYTGSINKLDYQTAYQEACWRALRNQNRLEIAPGEWTVLILEPAVDIILKFLMMYSFSGRSYLDKSSYLNEKLGQELFSPLISVREEPYTGDTAGAPFDFEAVTRKTTDIIKSGVAANLSLDTYTSNKLKMDNPGCGAHITTKSQPFFRSYQMAPGDKSVEELISSIEKGILISRSWYENIIDPVDLTITGMTRDGTFMIENGELTSALKDLRFNIPVFKLLKQVKAVSSRQKHISDYTSAVVSPILVDGFKFTGVSKEL